MDYYYIATDKYNLFLNLKPITKYLSPHQKIYCELILDHNKYEHLITVGYAELALFSGSY